MDREEILQKSRQENADEGFQHAEDTGRKIGFLQREPGRNFVIAWCGRQTEILRGETLSRHNDSTC